MNVIGNSYVSILGIGGIGCGGVSEQTMCQRAGWQVVDEILYKAYPIEYWGLGACNAYGCGAMDGMSDYETDSPYQMLGAAKSNGEIMITNGPSHANDAVLCPGACDDDHCNNAPLACAAYEPGAWTANVPDNIDRAAARLGKARVRVTIGSGITAGYTTCN